MSALEIAAGMGRGDIFLDLIESSLAGDEDRVDAEGRTLIHHCVVGYGDYDFTEPERRVECLRVVLDVCEKVIDYRDKGGLTPLHHACFKKWTSGVATLLQSACDVNVLDGEGRTVHDYARGWEGEGIVEEYGGRGGEEVAATAVAAAVGTPTRAAAPSNSMPSPSSKGWVQYYDEGNNPYIYHPVTGNSMWGILATGGGGSPGGGSPRGSPGTPGSQSSRVEMGGMSPGGGRMSPGGGRASPHQASSHPSSPYPSSPYPTSPHPTSPSTLMSPVHGRGLGGYGGLKVNIGGSQDAAKTGGQVSEPTASTLDLCEPRN